MPMAHTIPSNFAIVLAAKLMLRYGLHFLPSEAEFSDRLSSSSEQLVYRLV